MADISIYTDPGAYVQERIAQGTISLASVPLAVTLVGPAAKFRRIKNEVVVRGQVTQTLVVSGTFPHTAPLTLASDQSIDTTQIYRDGLALAKSDIQYNSTLQVEISVNAYKPGAVYTIAYIAPSSEQDALANASVDDILRVGSFANVTSFTKGTDYQLTSDEVDFSILTEATLLGIPVGPFNLSVNTNLKISLDGLPAITVNVVGATPAATTAAEIIGAINTALNGDINYGATYNTAASISAGKILLTGVVKGELGSVNLQEAATLSAHLEVFGIATVALPVTNYGVGKKPALGSSYYVSYDYERPATDFNAPKEFFAIEDCLEVVGDLASDNPLALHAQIAFENGAPSIWTVIIKDADSNGVYSDADFITGITATETKRGMTEIIPLSTSLAVQVALLSSVTNMSSVLEKKPRRAWYGMARGTDVGDEDTAGTFVYMSARTLQVPADSPGRGRQILAAPDTCSKVFTLEDGTQPEFDMDGVAVAVAQAALQTSFTSAATSLLNKTITGFSKIREFSDQERRRLASKGISVATFDAGKIVLTDPVSTEVAGGGLQHFSEISVMVQKDKVRTLVEDRVKSNLVGIVPEDLADFLSDIKEVVATTLIALVEAGDIGKFTNENGTARDINLSTDIQAFQSTTDKTKFGFRFYFNARYPAKRLFGEFSVDNPFFAPSAQAATS